MPAESALPESLRGLLQPGAYPHPVAEVTLIETQLSWVLLAGGRAYKLKRPVVYPFVDQRSLADRRRLCEEELRLNRRFVPQLYLEVCPVTSSGGKARIGGGGQVIEHAVVMRAFDRSEELDRLVAGQRVAASELAQFGQWLARVQLELPEWAGTASPGAASSSAGHPGDPVAVAAAVARNVEECARSSEIFGSSERVRAIGALLAAEIGRRRAQLAQRVHLGRIRECHADLHLSNVVRIDGQLRPFDSLEFEPAFRWLDVAADVAFLYADLLGFGEPRLAAVFLDAWLAESGDYHASAVLPLYTADRALVRAKVMALRAGQAGNPPAAGAATPCQRQQAYLSVAELALQQQAACCLMMTGLPGSGKSWLAAQLVPEIGAACVRSDVERKRLAGIPFLARSASPRGGGLYSEAGKAAVYERIVQCAADVLGGRRNVVVDANFGRREQRTALAEMCARLGAPLHVIQCEAPPALLRQRISARQAGAADASEADVGVLERQRRLREAIGDDERLDVITVDTAPAGALAAVLAQLRRRSVRHDQLYAHHDQ